MLVETLGGPGIFNMFSLGCIDGISPYLLTNEIRYTVELGEYVLG